VGQSAGSFEQSDVSGLVRLLDGLPASTSRDSLRVKLVSSLTRQPPAEAGLVEGTDGIRACLISFGITMDVDNIIDPQTCLETTLLAAES
jgi:hypothetical protein